MLLFVSFPILVAVVIILAVVRRALIDRSQAAIAPVVTPTTTGRHSAHDGGVPLMKWVVIGLMIWFSPMFVVIPLNFFLFGGGRHQVPDLVALGRAMGPVLVSMAVIGLILALVLAFNRHTRVWSVVIAAITILLLLVRSALADVPQGLF